jgi:hypothetical protein
MPKVKVFYFRVWDHASGANVVRPIPATLEAIKVANGTPIDMTEQEIDAAALDGIGFLRADVRDRS